MRVAFEGVKHSRRLTFDRRSITTVLYTVSEVRNTAPTRRAKTIRAALQE
jgi:hypothetical protein